MVPIPKIAAGSEFGPLRVRRGERVFVLTGAGVSAESGVPTFRDAGGLWEQHRVEDVATPEGFARDPEMVWRFYSQRRLKAREVRPNPAHLALARLGDRLGDDLFLCTQNVDALHERAGSKDVHHMHGRLLSTRCSSCGRAPFDDESAYETAPRCDCGALLRPDVVWFGEMPYGLPRIFDALEETDLFVTVGSSGAVYPAAGFVSHLRHIGRARCIYVGLERPDNAHSFDECRLGKAGELVPSLFDVT
ncbi:MAG: NAD-dependent deacylase [Myxococcales bacterium]|nr:NAD-dependent deacylase [Myxococcales bacterium]